MSQGHLTHLALPASREGISVLHSSNWRTHCTICINWILFLWESSNVFLSLCFLLSPLFLHLDRNWISKKNEYVRSLITTGKALQEATDSESTPEGCKLGFFFFYFGKCTLLVLIYYSQPRGRVRTIQEIHLLMWSFASWDFWTTRSRAGSKCVLQEAG